MRQSLIVFMLTGLSAFVLTQRADAHHLYRKVLAEKYDAQVKCYACHLSRDAAEKLSPEEQDHYRFHSKEFYNNFGQQLKSLLIAKGTDERMASYYRVGGTSEASQRKRDELRETATREFLEVFSRFAEVRDASSGKTHGELLKAGELEHIRLRTEPRPMPSDY